MQFLLLIMLALILGIPYVIYKNYEYRQQQLLKQKQYRILWQNSAVYILKHALNRSSQYFPIPKTENHGFENIELKVHKQGFCGYFLTYFCEPNTPVLDYEVLEQCRNILNTEIKAIAPYLVYSDNVPYVDLYVVQINSDKKKISICVVPAVDVISKTYIANFISCRQQQAIMDRYDGSRTLNKRELKDDEL